MMTSNEAREISDNAILKSNMDSVLESIKKAASEGKYSTPLEKFEWPVHDALKELGYKIIFNGDERNPKYTINW